MSAPTNDELIAAARAGDRRAFDALVAPARRAVLAHCYRMLGTPSDADDAAQETLLRAWRHLGSFEGRASLRTWLLRIATRVSLDLMAHRSARTQPAYDESAPADPSAMPVEPTLDPVWLAPLTDAAWCDGELDAPETPEASVTRRESVALAFLAAIQLLPPAQRAPLLLHEVAGWRAAEIAEALESSVAAVNGAMQRAREVLDARAPGWSRRGPARAPIAHDAAALARYLHAWNTGDPRALARTLRDDAVLAMPPMRAWYRGRAAIEAFAQMLFTALGPVFRLVRAPDTNGCPAVASYRAAPGRPGVYLADALHVLRLDDDGAIAEVMAFMGPAWVERAGLAVERGLDETA